jgi:Ger(x)C family germination protein
MVRAKRLALIALALCVAAAASGCWDSLDVNKKALVTLVVTDKQNGEYVFYATMPNLKKGGGQSREGGDGLQYESVTGRGGTLSEARRDLDSKMDNVPYLGTVRALVLTDNMIQDDFALYISRIDSIEEYRKALRIAVTFEKPEDLLASKPKSDESIGQSISDILTSSEHIHKIVSYSLTDIFNFRYSKMCFVLPNIGLEEGQLAFTGYSIMHNDRYLSSIPLDESSGLLYLLADEALWSFAVTLNGTLIAIDAELKNRRVKPYYRDGQVTFDVRLSFKSTVKYRSKSVPLDDAAMEAIRQQVVRRILDDVSGAITHSKAEQCDYLGFKNYFRIAYPNEARTIDWQSAYVASVMNISVNTTLEPKGMMDFEAGYENGGN